jgi:tRNA pseudouridine32 synthase/23S rRNA pseudouridine746 synthase
LQNELFNHYNFLNQKGEEKSLNQIFKAASYKNPPAGAGECAGPKLLQYAFQHQMKPLAIAEFWWGAIPKNQNNGNMPFTIPAVKKNVSPFWRICWMD